MVGEAVGGVRQCGVWSKAVQWVILRWCGSCKQTHSTSCCTLLT